MVYAYIQDVPIREDLYRSIIAKIGPEPIAGSLIHLCVRQPDGRLQYIDVWESEEACTESHWRHGRRRRRQRRGAARAQWRDLAARHDVSLTFIEVRCTDPEIHRTRLSARRAISAFDDRIHPAVDAAFGGNRPARPNPPCTTWTTIRQRRAAATHAGLTAWSRHRRERAQPAGQIPAS